MRPRWAVGAALPLAALLLEYSGADRWLLDAIHDPVAGAFPLADAWWTNQLLHEGGRALVRIIAVGALLVAVAGRAWRRLRPVRGAALYVFVGIALGCGLVNTLKATTNVDCPWSLARYGGDRPYVHVFAHRPDALPRARCFPAGHAAGGYSLLALYFVALALGWRRPRLWLLPGVLTGVVFGVGQWLRGAHFPSHDLWAAAVCWLVAAALYELMLRPRRAAAAAQEAQEAFARTPSSDGARGTSARTRSFMSSVPTASPSRVTR